jgi:hypothetical protein
VKERGMEVYRKKGMKFLRARSQIFCPLNSRTSNQSRPKELE